MSERLEYMDACPLVSAVITTHDRPELLKLAVQSVLEQTYENIELIIVNDNSGQETIDYLYALQARNPQVRHIYIPPEETKGGNYARNLGIRAANGEYIAFLDDDDRWLPEKIEKQVSLMNDQTGVVYCARWDEYAGNASSSYRSERLVKEEYVGDLSAKCLIYNFAQTSQLMIRKSLLLEVGGFDEFLGFWQETELLIRLCQITMVDAVRDKMVITRHDKSDKARLTNKLDGWMNAVDYINDKHKELIAALSKEDLDARNLMIARDKIMRCDSCGNKEERKKALCDIWQITGAPKDYVKYVLNRSHIKPACLSGGGGDAQDEIIVLGTYAMTFREGRACA